MENNEARNEEIKKEREPTTAGAHARFRKGMTDYADGGTLTHYLGNDDYHETRELKEDETEENPKLSGKEAGGNDLREEDVEEDGEK